MSNSNHHPEYRILKFHQNMGPFSIQEIAEVIGASIYKNSQKISALTENIDIHDVRTLKQATNRDVSFFSKQKYSDDLTQTNAVACITLEKYVEKAPQGVYVLVVSNVQIAYAKVVSLFYKVATDLEHNPQNAHIDPTAKLGTNCKVGYGSFIGKNAEIGNNTMIHPRVYIGDNVVIGDNCIIYDSCSIKHSIIGSSTIIHSGARIGQDGFGYSTENGRHLKIPQVGRVVIGNEVEIGANTTIDRGSLDDTIIGDMCKIDNLVQIGHNVRLGHGCIIVSQVGISGSTKLGNYVVLGGQVGIADNLSLGDCVQVGAKSGVMRDASSGSILMGYPAQNARDFFKQLAYLKKLSKI